MIGIINCYYVSFVFQMLKKKRKKRNKQLGPVGGGVPQVSEVTLLGGVTQGEKKRPNRKIDNVTKRIRNLKVNFHL